MIPIASEPFNSPAGRNLSGFYYVHHRANDDDHPLAASLEHIRRSEALMRDMPIGNSVPACAEARVTAAY